MTKCQLHASMSEKILWYDNISAARKNVRKHIWHKVRPAACKNFLDVSLIQHKISCKQALEVSTSDMRYRLHARMSEKSLCQRQSVSFMQECQGGVIYLVFRGGRPWDGNSSDMAILGFNLLWYVVHYVIVLLFIQQLFTCNLQFQWHSLAWFSNTYTNHIKDKIAILLSFTVLLLLSLDRKAFCEQPAVATTLTHQTQNRQVVPLGFRWVHASFTSMAASEH